MSLTLFPHPDQNFKQSISKEKQTISSLRSVIIDLLAIRMILPAWFDHLPVEKRFCHNEVQFKMFCLPVKS